MKTTPSALRLAPAALLFSLCAHAGELTQSFVNPDFGGNPLNGGYLLSNATAINQHNAPSTSVVTTSTGGATTTPTAGQQFAQQLDRLVMTALANRLVTKAFGVGSSTLPTSSTFDTGINTVTIEDTGTGTRVTIIDDATGSSTVLDIPNY